MNKRNYPCTFFRIPAESPCGHELGKLLLAMEKVENAASEKALKLGAEYYEPSNRTGAGGIGMFYFALEPNASQWDVVEQVEEEDGGRTLYAAIPNESTEEGKAVLEELSRLPMVPAVNILRVLGLKVLRTKNGVKMPSFQRIEEDGELWYYLNTCGAEFMPGKQEELYNQGMERVGRKRVNEKLRNS